MVRYVHGISKQSIICTVLVRDNYIEKYEVTHERD